MRRTWLFVVALTPSACSLLVDTSHLTGGPNQTTTGDAQPADETGAGEAGGGDAAADVGTDDVTSARDAATDAPTVPTDAPSAGDGATSAAYRSAVLADGPWAYFRLDDASGCVDEKGGTPCALSASGVTHGVAGIAGSRAVRLGQVTSTLTTALGTGDLGQSYTVEAWIAVDSASAVPANDLADFEDFAPARGGLTMFLFTGSEVRTETWSGGQFLSYTLSAAALTPSVYHHVVTGYDAQSKLDFSYFDGALCEGGTQQSDAGRPTVTHPLVWGGWTGSIDELAIYTKALAPARVLAHYGLR